MKAFIRILHIVAITVLIGSAGYAYSTKYEALYYAETLAKTKGKLQRERESIAVAKAEWALLTRPDRLQKMVDKHLDLQPMQISQLARLADIPAKPSKEDEISRKIETLGLETGSIGKAADRAKPVRSGDELGRKLQSLGLDPGAAPSAETVARPHKRTDKTADAHPQLRPPSAPKATADKAPGDKPAAPKPEKRAEAKAAPRAGQVHTPSPPAPKAPKAGAPSTTPR